MTVPKNESADMENKPSPELEKLVKEKVTLAKKLGMMGGLKPVENYEKSDEYKRLQEIDNKLWELVK
ncbi:hypothetical protein D3C74_152140 [compost metagenome]